MGGEIQSESADQAKAAQQEQARAGFQQLEEGQPTELKEGADKKNKTEFEYSPGENGPAATKSADFLKTTNKFKKDDTDEYIQDLKNAISKLWDAQKIKVNDVKQGKGGVGRTKDLTTVESDTEVDYGGGKIIKFKMTSNVENKTHQLQVRV